MNKKVYPQYVQARAERSRWIRNSLRAFWTGGVICTIAQALKNLYQMIPGKDDSFAGALTSVTLIFLAVVLTGLGCFDVLARYAGAGTLVPITGFANAVVSPAIDSRSEGPILGVGAKIFTVAGPVLLYGTLSGAIYGVLYYLAKTVFSL